VVVKNSASFCDITLRGSLKSVDVSDQYGMKRVANRFPSLFAASSYWLLHSLILNA
jgi:hypothetical protein